MLPVIQSDIMLKQGDRTLVIDAKYYANTTQKQYDVRELLRACYYAIDKKPISEIPLTVKEKMLLKSVLKKVKGTDVEILLKESGLIE